MYCNRIGILATPVLALFMATACSVTPNSTTAAITAADPSALLKDLNAAMATPAYAANFASLVASKAADADTQILGQLRQAGAFTSPALKVLAQGQLPAAISGFSSSFGSRGAYFAKMGVDHMNITTSDLSLALNLGSELGTVLTGGHSSLADSLSQTQLARVLYTSTAVAAAFLNKESSGALGLDQMSVSKVTLSDGAQVYQAVSGGVAAQAKITTAADGTQHYLTRCVSPINDDPKADQGFTEQQTGTEGGCSGTSGSNPVYLGATVSPNQADPKKADISFSDQSTTTLVYGADDKGGGDIGAPMSH